MEEESFRKDREVGVGRAGWVFAVLFGFDFWLVKCEFVVVLGYDKGDRN